MYGGDIISFQALSFTYADVPTEIHGLTMTSINGPGESSVSSGSRNTLVTDRTFRDPVHHLFAIEQSEPLEFEVEITSQTAVDRFDVVVLANWLTEQDGYQKLQIDQDDLKNAYFNCVFTNMSNIYYHNSAYSFRCVVRCDAPWAWEWERRRTYSFKTGSLNTFKFNNTSSSKNMLMPVFDIDLSSNTSSFSLTNKSANNLIMSFTGLSPGEHIYIDCKNKILYSFDRPNTYITNKFNKKFLGFIRGYNEIDVIGNIDNMTIKFQHSLKVGG